jgi:hypothetical protein
METHGITVPESWGVDSSSHRLDNEGKSVVLLNEDEQFEVWIEGMLFEDVGDEEYDGDTLGFWGVLRQQSGGEWKEVEGPSMFSPMGYGTTEAARENALEWLEEIINTHG